MWRWRRKLAGGSWMRGDDDEYGHGTMDTFIMNNRYDSDGSEINDGSDCMNTMIKRIGLDEFVHWSSKTPDG